MSSTRKFKKSKNPRKLAHRSQAGSAIGSIGEEISPSLLHATSPKKKKKKKALVEPKQISWRSKRHQARPEDVHHTHHRNPRFTFNNTNSHEKCPVRQPRPKPLPMSQR